MKLEMCKQATVRKTARSIAVGVLAFCLAVPQTWAWGREGHRLTALVADHYLNAAARANVELLLAADSKSKETLADVAPWADEYRTAHPETGAWHYVDIPKAESKFDRNRDCPVSKTDPTSPWRDCVTDRILYFEGRLGDTSLSMQERAIALKFLVHFMGDIHQPFHAMGDDRGGNSVMVHFLGSDQCGNYRCNLHGVWDDSMIEHRGLSEAKYTDALLKEIDENHWDRLSGGEPTTWANVSHHYAVEAYAPNGALLSKQYVEEETKVVDAELSLGGLRLARMLNRILGDAATTQPATEATKPADAAPKM